MAAPPDREALETLSDELRAGGHDVRTATGDIADPGTSDAAVAEAMDGFGRLDYLVNNAGIYPERPLFEETADFYDRIFAINVVGLQLLCRAATAVMTAPGGAITCTASTCSLRAIESGLKADDLVIVNGILRARPESKVQPRQGPMPGEQDVENFASTQVSLPTKASVCV